MPNDDNIVLAHGEGGLATKRLIESVFAPKFSNPILERMEDSAIVEIQSKKLAFTTDGFIVEPIFFPGGDIGKLAASGTINDLAAMGAKPKYFSASFIIEEGLKISDMDKIANSFAETIHRYNSELIAADTKVVPRGTGGGIYIAVSGIGEVIIDVGLDKIQPYDDIVISGDIARHSAAILAARENIDTNPILLSDCAPLWEIVKLAIDENIEIHTMRDPTRGGLATVLVEISEQTNLGMIIDEAKIPIEPQVKSLCDIYGFDPLYLANEGKMIFIVKNGDGENLVELLREKPLSQNAELIGSVSQQDGVVLKTETGGKRKLIMLEGEQLPRIC